jgi:hypothetical protein
VALVALHTAFAEEPLLMDDNHQVEGSTNETENETSTSAADEVNATSANTTVDIQDIPRTYRGPFRIYSIDSFGTGMVCAG